MLTKLQTEFRKLEHKVRPTNLISDKVNEINSTAAQVSFTSKEFTKEEYEKIKEINKVSFWTTLETDVNKGFEVAAVVVGTFEPQLGPLFLELSQVLGAVETIFSKPATSVAPATLSPIVQAAATMHAVNATAAKVNSGSSGNSVIAVKTS